MKLSILTPTYNRANLLGDIYDSLIINKEHGLNFEWLIMDDGSTDDTKEIVQKFIAEKKIDIKYFYQENQGKMAAINNLVKYSTGEMLMDLDSDDYLANNAMKIIKEKADILKTNKDLYAMLFLKCDIYGEVSGNKFKDEKNKTTMFDLYFKEEVEGEKIIVFSSDVRKTYNHKLENDEKFVTEARMYHQMDREYKVVCFNIPIVIGDYRKDGYTKNIQKLFRQAPKGYYEYFKEILEKDFKGVRFKKRLYVIKHYILFSVLAKQKNILHNVNGNMNKFLVAILYIPGRIKTVIKFGRE